MKLAILSDIHANWHALERVIYHVDQVTTPDQVICLGDVVGYNAFPAECMFMVKDRGWECLMGNHDEAVVDDQSAQLLRSEALEVVMWTRQQLTEYELAWLKQRPYFSQIEEDLSFTHASFSDQSKWPYIKNTIEARHGFEGLTTKLGFYGHTHRPKVFHQKGVGVEEFELEKQFDFSSLVGACLVNVGSVGQPRDGDWRASYCVFDTTTQRLEHHRIEYDIRSAAQAVIDAGLPKSLAERLFKGA